jgi:hypothetical protein
MASKPKASNGSNSFEVTFVKEKETKGAVQYKETVEGERKIGTLYVRKDIFDGSFPNSLKVTVAY